MAKTFFTALFFLMICLIVMFNFMSCSEEGIQGGYTFEQQFNIDSEPIHEAFKSKINPIKEDQKSTIENIFNLEQQYKLDCHVSEWFFCPPSLFTDEIWEFELITDYCADPPQIVYMGDCIKKFECDPANTNVEIIPCIYDENDGILGLKEKWCDKGQYKFGPCEACAEEVCDGLDNDCDGSTDEDLDPADRDWET